MRPQVENKERPGKRSIVKPLSIENRIFTFRGVQVMVDSHLAELYGVETKRLNEQVRRNKERFPSSFRFQLSHVESEILRSQFATSSSDHGGRRYYPYVFKEQGVAMLSAVLKSDTAINVSIQIMQAFVQMRKFIADQTILFQQSFALLAYWASLKENKKEMIIYIGLAILFQPII